MNENHGSRAASPTETDARSRWGSVKFGRRGSAFWFAFPIGVVLAIGIGALTIATGVAGPWPLLGGAAFAFVTAWPCFGLVWAFVVDRETLRGAIDKPEQSVESAWYSAAASSAFTDVLLIVGLGTAAVAFTGVELPTALILTIVIVVAMGAFAVRYLVQRRRG